jgi:hypothetical protein
MDNLLMAVSPMFRQRFQQALYDRLQSVHGGPGSTVPLDAALLQQQQQQQNTQTTLASSPIQQPSSVLLQNPNPNPNEQQQQQQQLDLNHALSQDVLDDLHNWIH